MNLTAIFVPDVIALGGGLGAEHDLFAAAVDAVMATHSTMVPTARVQVRPAARPDDAGLLGAAYAALRAA